MNITLMIVMGAGVIIILLIFFRLLNDTTPQKSPYKYQKRKLLSQNELNFYKSLYPIATKKGFILLSKVRLFDLIEPLKGSSNWTESKNKIAQKHVDFVLCDSIKINPMLVIELDDATHDRADRQQRDKFIDQALESAGIPILHTRTTEKLEEMITAKLSPKIPLANSAKK